MATITVECIIKRICFASRRTLLVASPYKRASPDIDKDNLFRLNRLLLQLHERKVSTKDYTYKKRLGLWSCEGTSTVIECVFYPAPSEGWEPSISK